MRSSCSNRWSTSWAQAVAALAPPSCRTAAARPRSPPIAATIRKPTCPSCGAKDKLVGPFDHDVPVLKITDRDGQAQGGAVRLCLPCHGAVRLRLVERLSGLCPERLGGETPRLHGRVLRRLRRRSESAAPAPGRVGQTSMAGNWPRAVDKVSGRTAGTDRRQFDRQRHAHRAGVGPCAHRARKSNATCNPPTSTSRHGPSGICRYWRRARRLPGTYRYPIQALAAGRRTDAGHARRRSGRRLCPAAQSRNLARAHLGGRLHQRRDGLHPLAPRADRRRLRRGRRHGLLRPAVALGAECRGRHRARRAADRCAKSARNAAIGRMRILCQVAVHGATMPLAVPLRFAFRRDFSGSLARRIMRTTWSFSSAGQIIFGSPARPSSWATSPGGWGSKRVLVVTDEQLVARRRVRSKSQVRWPSRPRLSVSPAASRSPRSSAAERCVAHASAFKPDGLIGLGGGSNMDLAKIAAAVLAHGGSPRDYLGEDKVPGPGLPLVCIPTTAGTGSEVSAAGVFTDTGEQHQSRRDEQLSSAGRGPGRSAADAHLPAQSDGR